MTLATLFCQFLELIKLKPDAVSVIHPLPLRGIPVALTDKLEKGLKRVEDLGVIVKVSVPTYWVKSIGTPEKQRTGSLRVYLDSRDLNQAIVREHYPLPTLEDLNLLLPDTFSTQPRAIGT